MATTLGLLLTLTGGATHSGSCEPEAADPSTYHEVATPDGRTFYLEERPREPGTYDVPPPTLPPPALWGFAFGDGTYLYEETNGVEGLQVGYANDLMRCLVSAPGVCLFPQDDPIAHQHCGHGPDHGWLLLRPLGS